MTTAELHPKVKAVHFLFPCTVIARAFRDLLVHYDAENWWLEGEGECHVVMYYELEEKCPFAGIFVSVEIWHEIIDREEII